MKRLIEFIESYWKIDDCDYKWNDNHGELIRCRDCKYFNGENKYCDYNLTVESDDYCSFAERRAE